MSSTAVMTIAARYGLTDKQAGLVAGIARGLDATTAALNVGYAQATSLQVSQTLKLPHVRAALMDELTRVLQQEAAPLALSVLLKVTRDETTSARVRVDAAKILLDRAGFAPKPGGNQEIEKTLAEMSPAELRAFIDKQEADIAKAEAAIAEQLEPVNAPKEGLEVPNVADMLA